MNIWQVMLGHQIQFRFCLRGTCLMIDGAHRRWITHSQAQRLLDAAVRGCQ